MDFVQFAASHGVIVEHPIADGRVRRVPTVHRPKKRNAKYRLFSDGFGWVNAYDSADGFNFYRPDTKPDPARVAEWKARADRERVEQAAEWARRAYEALEIVRRCTYASHPYLVNKGFVDARGLVDPSTVTFRIDDDVVEPHADCLVVPMRHYRTAELQSIQWVSATGRKKYLPGGRAWNACFSIGAPRVRAVVCEGYATGKTIAEALALLYRQERVVVCFSAANLKHVAPQFGPDTIVVADNDAPDKHGRQAGQEAAQATGLPWVMPEDQDTDADDLRQRCGIRAVADLLRAIL
ncbi:MAG: toprim domain-containing protein [Lautropia sp.]